MFSSHSLNGDKLHVLEDTVLCSCTIINDHMLAFLFVKYIQENFSIIGSHHFFTALVKQ